MFTSSDAQRLCGLGIGELTQWTRRGIVSIAPPDGKGHPRQFSFWNLVEAQIGKSLSLGLGMPAAHLEIVMQGIRDRIKENGVPESFPLSAIYSGDWSAWIIKSGDGHRVLLRHGALPDDALFPVVAIVSISAIAQGLIDQIDGDNGSIYWSKRAVDARRANAAGHLYEMPLAANTFKRDMIPME